MEPQLDEQMRQMEAAVISIIAEQAGSDRSVIEAQYAAATVVERSFSGAGFFTTFVVSQPIPRMSEELSQKRAFGQVLATFSAAADLGFLLFLTEDGLLDFLEGYTYGDDEWRPESMPPTDVKFEQVSS